MIREGDSSVLVAASSSFLPCILNSRVVWLERSSAIPQLRGLHWMIDRWADHKQV